MKKLLLYAALFIVICFSSCENQDQDSGLTNQTYQEPERTDPVSGNKLCIHFKDGQNFYFDGLDYIISRKGFLGFGASQENNCYGEIQFSKKEGYEYYYSSSNYEENPEYDVIIGWSGENTKSAYEAIARSIKDTGHYAECKEGESYGECLPSGGNNIQLLHSEIDRIDIR